MKRKNKNKKQLEEGKYKFPKLPIFLIGVLGLLGLRDNLPATKDEKTSTYETNPEERLTVDDMDTLRSYSRKAECYSSASADRTFYYIFQRHVFEGLLAPDIVRSQVRVFRIVEYLSRRGLIGMATWEGIAVGDFAKPDTVICDYYSGNLSDRDLERILIEQVNMVGTDAWPVMAQCRNPHVYNSGWETPKENLEATINYREGVRELEAGSYEKARHLLVDKFLKKNREARSRGSFVNSYSLGDQLYKSRKIKRRDTAIVIGSFHATDLPKLIQEHSAEGLPNICMFFTTD